MLLEEALFNMMSADPGLIALVGAKIFPNVMPQRDQSREIASPNYPAVVFSLVNRSRTYTHDGPDGMVESTYGIASLSKTYFEAKQVAEAVRFALNGRANVLQGYFSDDDVSGIYLDDEFDDYVYDEVEYLSAHSIEQKWVIQHRELLQGVT